ncbi:MAG: DUF4153 domain-containing protein [Sphingobium sp.]|nr:DUF4153 domain-containing protein [Sphingobium sp.]MCP5398049.1 DUF4153 domain-containing protein [Sphingomonas sp.]
MVADLNPDEPASGNDAGWPLRSWGLALLGALVGLAIYHIVNEGSRYHWTEDATRLALASFLSTAGIAFAFVVERGRIKGSAIFAIIAGLVVASVLYWSGDFTSWEPWRLVSALLTIAIAAPLFQGWRDGGSRKWHIPYVETHNRAWTNVCLWFATWAFVGLVFLLAWLLAALFNLIGIDALEELLKKNWFAMMLAGASFGGACGLLRDHERIVRLLQRVIMIVLSVLAPVLAIGLVLFLIALPFTGLEALWETTKSTTPILLSCVIGALILANAVIGDKPEDEAKLRPMRWSAMALGVVILPLGIIAAISTGLRIQQYGLTPERLWAVTFTAIACAYGLAYLVSLARGREAGWTGFVRPANMRLAVGLCALAFLLSTPLISFGALSTRNQIARLESGKVSADKFDFAALRFDFGPAGMKALKKLAKDGKTKEIRTAATDMLASDSRYAAVERKEKSEARRNIVTLPKDAKLPEALVHRLAQYGACAGEKPCNVIYRPEAGEAIVVGRYGSKLLKQDKDGWNNVSYRDARLSNDEAKAINEAFKQGRAEIQNVERRQVFIDGKPVGKAFE